MYASGRMFFADAQNCSNSYASDKRFWSFQRLLRLELRDDLNNVITMIEMLAQYKTSFLMPLLNDNFTELITCSICALSETIK